ncbi:MAG: PGF-CTERM sorting domain-containing protein, partial [Candidatus Heimdallarchaeota archaeon]
DAIPADNTESLLLQGTAYDDYEDYYVTVWVDTWENTWGSLDYVSVNLITGAWSYLLVFNEMDMPLGTNNVSVTLHAPYEADITIWYEADFDDINAPTLIGITDLEARYPTGVEGDIGNVVVTVGLSDDYDNVNYLTAQIYSRMDDGVAFTSPMLQFYPDTTTFNGNITIDPTLDFSIQHNITYWIDAYDTSLNRVTSAEYTFFTAVTILTPGFGIIAGVFGLAVVVLFVKKFKK